MKKSALALAALTLLACASAFAQDGQPNPPAVRIDRPGFQPQASVVLSPGMQIELMPFQRTTVTCGGGVLPPPPAQGPLCKLVKNGSLYSVSVEGTTFKDNFYYLDDALKQVRKLRADGFCVAPDAYSLPACVAGKDGSLYTLSIGNDRVDSF